MGFPEWTLWGMGLSVAGALIAITLSWLGQSPQMLRRLGLGSARLDLRVRAFTGYALALLLLAVAFFLAGVPLDTSAENGAVSELAEEPGSESVATSDPGNDGLNTENSAVELTPATPATGAFSGPPVSSPSSLAGASPSPEVESQVTRIVPTFENTEQITSTTESAEIQPSPTTTLRPTETATPQPTDTPFPTLTPTRITDETAVVSTSGSTIWLKRSPGGQNVVLVRDGDLVLVRDSRANQDGILWRQVATLAGIEGWLQEEFLIASESGSTG
jgi:hypothetical protein